MQIQSINPATRTILQRFDAAGQVEVAAAVESARQAQKAWEALSLDEREGYFIQLAEVLQQNLREIVTTIHTETGKRLPECEGEVFEVIDTIGYFLKKIRTLQADHSTILDAQVFPDTNLIVDYVPHGVVGLIMPWNFPFNTALMTLVTAVIAGNTVVLKPSEYSTLVGLMIGDLLQKAKFPPGIANIVVGGKETGQLLVQADVDKIFFIGSLAAGRHILANAGIKPVQVELGGNSAALVLADADLDLAAQAIAWAGTYNAGQDCVGVKRVIVVASVADAFLEKLTQIVQGLRPGIDYGPYIRPEAMHVVKQRIDDAVAGGARLLWGGESIQLDEGQGNWLIPSVLSYEDTALELVAQETFGNTIPVLIVPDEETAVQRANETEYGLSAVIFSADVQRAKLLAYQVETGMVFINDPVVSIPGMDHWTGWKNSGLGTTESRLMQCLKKKVISVNHFGHKRSFWYPY